MTTGVDHSKEVILNAGFFPEIVHSGAEGIFGCEQRAITTSEVEELRMLSSTNNIDRLILCGAVQPGPGVFRNTSELPGFKGTHKSILYNVLCQFKVFAAKDLDQNGNHLSGLLPEKMVYRGVDTII